MQADSANEVAQSIERVKIGNMKAALGPELRRNMGGIDLCEKRDGFEDLDSPSGHN